ncbi:MAG: hypothetical protein M0C28_30050 [Candidatus Moduliflexus flocculans]|nr:hypothetical protein [Candidatus Moduliflexus flocculans]
MADLSVLVTKYRSKEALDNEKIAAFGHMGTHFDVMDKEFPLEYVPAARRRVPGCPAGPGSRRSCPGISISPSCVPACSSSSGQDSSTGTSTVPGSTSRATPSCRTDSSTPSSSAGSMIGIDFAGMRRGPERPRTSTARTARSSSWRISAALTGCSGDDTPRCAQSTRILSDA